MADRVCRTEFSLVDRLSFQFPFGSIPGYGCGEEVAV